MFFWATLYYTRLVTIFIALFQGHAKELTFTHHKNHSTAIQIVTQVIDNIKGYTNLYNVFRDFAVAYENYFNKRDCRVSL
jgi:hypothetical protein